MIPRRAGRVVCMLGIEEFSRENHSGPQILSRVIHHQGTDGNQWSEALHSIQKLLKPIRVITHVIFSTQRQPHCRKKNIHLGAHHV